MNSIYKIEKEKSVREVSNDSSKMTKRDLYDNTKFRVKNLEEKNTSNLILFQSGEGWYKMVGNSLVIYYNEIAKKYFRKKPNIQPDSDYTKTVFEDGVICFRGVDSLEKKLRNAGLIKLKKEENGIVIFQLQFSVSKQELERMRHDFKLDQDRALSILRPTATLAPELYEALRIVQKRTFEMARKMSIFERDYSGMMIADYGRKMMKYYMMVNMKMIPEREAWKKIIELANLLLIEISFAAELKIWSRGTAVSLGEKVVEVRKEAERRNECS
ncbi:hypothetical protein IJH46_02405 [Candidatus Saccharibacteria bacterium]|nr:hypothetical protein [Candidatus Saccharibacteria bacterium]